MNWLPEVDGYDASDSTNFYSGEFGETITALRVSGGKKYTVHVIGGGWLPYATGNDQNDYGYRMFISVILVI